MKIQLPKKIADQITKLVADGEYKSEQDAIERLLANSLRRKTNLTSARFGYEEPVFTEEEIISEIWAKFPIPGFSKYEISSLGRVRSLRFGTKPIKLSCQSGGYRQAPVRSDDGKNKYPLVQRLVATAFFPASDVKAEVNHRNGNKADNRMSNLEWVTSEENNQHSTETGLRHWRGAHHRAKITEADVRLIRAEPPEAAGDLSVKYGVSKGQIRNIQLFVSWKHVK